AMISGANDIQIEDASQSEGRVYQALIDRADREITIAILGQTLTSGGEGGGSYALGQVHELVRQDLRDADARDSDASWRDQLLTLLVRLNLGPRHPVPYWVTQTSEEEDLAQLASSVKTLTEAGLAIPASWAYEKFGIPEPRGGESVLVPPQIAALTGAPAAEQTANAAIPAQPKRPLAANAQRESRMHGAAAKMHMAANQTPGEAPDSGELVDGPVPEDGLAWLRERRVADEDTWDRLGAAGRQRVWYVTGLDQARTAAAARELLAARELGEGPNAVLGRLEAAGLSVPGGQEPASGQIPAARPVSSTARTA
ncbi:MAG: phage portal protein family protein, partial [Planctomycetota bacterium]